MRPRCWYWENANSYHVKKYLFKNINFLVIYSPSLAYTDTLFKKLYMGWWNLKKLKIILYKKIIHLFSEFTAITHFTEIGPYQQNRFLLTSDFRTCIIWPSYKFCAVFITVASLRIVHRSMESTRKIQSYIRLLDWISGERIKVQ